MEVQAQPSDSCVDVWSQDVSLDCVSVPVGSWRTSFPSKPSRHPECTQNPRFGSGVATCSGMRKGRGGRRAVYPSSWGLLGESWPLEIKPGINTCCQKSGIGKINN